MHEEPKQKVRIVSKPEFAWRLSKDVVLIVIRATCWCLGFIGACLATLSFILWLVGPTERIQPVVWFLTWALLSVITYLLLYLSTAAKHRLETEEPVGLLTRQTASQLPPEESLVRASSEPSQAQAKVLLRAAASGQETPAEELLRASEPELCLYSRDEKKPE